jgi:hypothetical protein
MKRGLNFNYNNLYFFGLCLIVAGLPLSKVGMSVGEIIIVGSWFLGGKIITKINSFFKNKTALIISSLFLLHLIGLLYTTDFDYALKDLRTKLPLLFLPLIISTSEPLGDKKFRSLMLVAILAVFVSTIFSMYNYFTMQFIDIRDICIFISHIRLSLLICLSIFVLYSFIIGKNDFSKGVKFLFILLILWFLVFLVILESFTGISILIVCSVFLLAKKIFSTKKILMKIILVLGIIVIPTVIYFYINDIYKTYFNYPVDKREKLEYYSPRGNPYFNDTLSSDVENGHYVYIYICDEELAESWNRRSKINIDGVDLKGQGIRSTLIRFLTSKGLRKDSIGMSQISDAEVKAIESGVADINLMKMHSINARIYETIWEYENYKETNDPNGHSLMLRFEYWKTSWEIIKKNFLIGVGTGDLNAAFARQYDEMKSRVDKQWRVRSHNQFLSITVAFGIIGLLWFLFVLLYPLFFRKYRNDFYFVVFLMILILSMLTEDTIETQAGLTFFAFYSTLLLLGRDEGNEKPVNSAEK